MDPIEQIKQNLSIVDVVGSYVELKKSGRNFKAVCPFHSEKTPSFMVSPELQIYKCFGCGKGGDIFNFVEEVEGLDFAQALQQLADKAGVKLPKKSFEAKQDSKKVIYEINEVAAEFFHYVLTEHKVGKNALEYFKKDRGLDMETIKEFRLGYAPKSWDTLHKLLKKKKFSSEDCFTAGVISKKSSGNGYIDKFRGRVMFPLVGLGGKVLGFNGRTIFDESPKYMNSPESPIFTKSTFLYGLYKSKIDIKKDGVVLVEGSMDVISSYKNGIKNTVASSGTALTQGQLKILSRYTNDLTLCFDSDDAGIEASKKAIKLAEPLEFNTKVVILPEEYKDLDDLVRNNNKKAKEVIKDAVPIYDFFIFSALKKYDRHEPIGKKKIIDELKPIFTSLENAVLLDHYIKQIADSLGVSIASVREMFSKKQYFGTKNSYKDTISTGAVEIGMSRTRSQQEYILSLLLKAPLDTAQTVLYKLGQKDFTNPEYEEIFTNLKKYLLGRKRKFEIRHFTKRFEQELQDLVGELYLEDLGRVSQNEDLLVKELDAVFERVKKDSVRRELKEISLEIKDAETANDKKLLDELMVKFRELSKKLV